jgi:cell wall-associated NlpC family hydrolase
MSAHVIRAAAAALFSIALAACAGTARKSAFPPDSLASPPPSAAAASTGARSLADVRLNMIDNAIAMLGQPYRFGGAAPGGFDCSGLVAYAAKGAGIHVPRTALEQFDTGTSVARGEVAPGDLIFMHLTHKELHVGIAIGSERFIHAPSTGGYVRIDLLTAAPYAKGFLGARRIIDAR